MNLECRHATFPLSRAIGGFGSSQSERPKTAITRPAFEVATIRPSIDAPRQAVAAAGRTDSAQFRIAGLTIRDYISMGYAVRLNQISGPDWITTDRFDIAATLPEGSQPDQVPGMMQTLLEDRFELNAHREKKEFPVYALRVSSAGLKLTEVLSDPEEQSGPQSGSAQSSAGRARHRQHSQNADRKLTQL